MSGKKGKKGSKAADSAAPVATTPTPTPVAAPVTPAPAAAAAVVATKDNGSAAAAAAALAAAEKKVAIEQSARSTGRAAVITRPGGVDEPVQEFEGMDDQVAAQLPIIILSVEAPSGKTVKVETTPADCVLDVRQFLLDCPETCDVTCFHLEHDGHVLNDYVELSEYKALNDASQNHVLKIVPDFYDERDARLHVRRLRELLVNPPAHVNHAYVLSSFDTDASPAAPVPTTTASSKKKKGGKGGVDAKKQTTPIAAAKKPDTIKADTVDEEKKDSNGDSKDEESLSLRPFHTDTTSSRKREAVRECVRNITFSAWNPPPGNRRLRGDLLYLEVSTLEGNQLHITSSVDGFFVNQSSSIRFDPSAAESHYKSHTLVDLLKKASPRFSSQFSALINRRVTSHPFENIDVARPIVPWLAPVQSHTFDWNRAEDALLSTFGMDSRGVLRDWNEEFQSCRELPRKTLNERIMRDRTIFRVYSDFVDAATKGACAIVHGNIPPINPMDPKRSYVYIYNNCFFSFAIDGRDQYQSVGGDKVSFQVASHDLRGIAAYASVDLPDLYTLATALIDYRGHRVIAQSIIPGIFHGDRASSHVYGSMDQGEHIESQEAFHQLMKAAAEKLHLAEHKIADKDGKAVSLYGCMESKGIKGSDGRNYILDLIRTTPRDANFPDAKTHPAALLRPELMTLYCRHLALEKFMTRKNAKKEGKTGEKKADAMTLEEAIASGMEDEVYFKLLNEITFNPDVLTNARLADGDERAASDLAAIEGASKFLVDTAIPKLVDSLATLEASPVDAGSLTRLLHERGVNIRYLSKVATLAAEKKLPHIELMCREEMITRCAKYLLSQALRAVRPDRSKQQEHWFLAPCMARFLSSLLGPHCGGHRLTGDQLNAAKEVMAREDAKQKEREAKEAKEDKKSIIAQPATTTPATSSAASAAAAAPVDEEEEEEEEKETTKAPAKKGGKKNKKNKKAGKESDVRLADGSRAPSDPLAPANLWYSIRSLVQDKYNYTLPTSMEFTARTKVCMLRSLCQKAGIQVASRDYDLSPASDNMTPFTSDDILDLFPVVKANFPVSKDASDTLEHGRAHLREGRLELAYQSLSESLGIHNQVYGPMHRDSAACYSGLALVCYHAMDYVQAVEHQQRAVVICERVLGLDHPETAHAHSNLALFLHSVGYFDAALKHIKRALFLFELMAGPNHPDTAATHINLAMILQDTGAVPRGLEHLRKALQRHEATLGPDHVQVALSHHTIAIAYSLMGQFRDAVLSERKSKEIFAAALGPKHPRVQQCTYWVDQFTERAVKVSQGRVEMPDRMKEKSPLTWVSLRSSTPFKGRLTMNDVLQLFETANQRAVDSGAAIVVPPVVNGQLPPPSTATASLRDAKAAAAEAAASTSGDASPSEDDSTDEVKSSSTPLTVVADKAAPVVTPVAAATTTPAAAPAVAGKKEGKKEAAKQGKAEGGKKGKQANGTAKSS